MRRGISTAVPLILLLAGCGPQLPDITGPLDLVDIRNNIYVVGENQPDEEFDEWNNAYARDNHYSDIMEAIDGRYQVIDYSTIDTYFEMPALAIFLPADERAVFGDSQLNLYGAINDDESMPDNVYCTFGRVEEMIENAQDIGKPVFVARSKNEDLENPLVLIFVNRRDYDTVVMPYCPQDNSQEPI
tara:strand:+ start:559 stop:1119 length:561 start_codon:yes stop_codon:yes gene_type:complete